MKLLHVNRDSCGCHAFAAVAVVDAHDDLTEVINPVLVSWIVLRTGVVVMVRFAKTHVAVEVPFEGQVVAIWVGGLGTVERDSNGSGLFGWRWRINNGKLADGGMIRFHIHCDSYGCHAIAAMAVADAHVDQARSNPISIRGYVNFAIEKKGDRNLVFGN